MVFIEGSGTSISLSVDAETITDSGGRNILYTAGGRQRH
jgi:hypothetical protein